MFPAAERLMHNRGPLTMCCIRECFSVWSFRTLGLTRGINCFQKLKSRCFQVKNHYSQNVLKCLGMRIHVRKDRRWENLLEDSPKRLLRTEFIEHDLFLVLVPML